MPSYSKQLSVNVIQDGSSIEEAPNQGSAFYLDIAEYWMSLFIQALMTDDQGDSDVQHMIWARTRDNGIWRPLARIGPIETFVDYAAGTTKGYTFQLPVNEHFGAMYDLLAIKQNTQNSLIGVSVRVSNEGLESNPRSLQLTALPANLIADVTPSALSDGVQMEAGFQHAAGLFEISGASVSLTVELWGLLKGLGVWSLEKAQAITTEGSYILTYDAEKVQHYSRLALGVSQRTTVGNGTVTAAMISQSIPGIE